MITCILGIYSQWFYWVFSFEPYIIFRRKKYVPLEYIPGCEGAILKSDVSRKLYYLQTEESQSLSTVALIVWFDKQPRAFLKQEIQGCIYVEKRLIATDLKETQHVRRLQICLLVQKTHEEPESTYPS